MGSAWPGHHSGLALPPVEPVTDCPEKSLLEKEREPTLKLQIGIDGNTYELEVEVVEDDEAPKLPHFGMAYSPMPTTVSTPAAPAHAAVGENVADEAKVCRSPVTGVVIKVNVSEGQEITENELLIVIEAMKMETGVTAPRAGKIKTIRVNPGDSVKVNQVVIECE